jgi:hypothetical protein
MVISQDEMDKKKQKDDDAKAAYKKKEVQNFQRLQMMGGDPVINQPVSEAGSIMGAPLSSNASLRKRVA